jgi:hypothetical protein
VLLSLITVLAAVEEEEPNKTLFYIAGALLVAFALIVGGLGVARHESFPPSDGATKGLMALAALLVAFVMASAVITG